MNTKAHQIKKLRQRQTPLSVLNDDACEHYLFPRGKFGYSVPRDAPVNAVRYFNQRLLNFNQTYASDPDYIFSYQVSL